MKENTFEEVTLLFKPCHKKALRRMKTTLLFLFFFATGLFATEVHSQVARVTLDMKNASIRDVLREIEKQSDYLFIFSPNEIDLNKKTSLNMKDKMVSEVLTTIFKHTDIAYAMEGNNIMLLKVAEVFQQNKKNITGTVTDIHGDPIIGANIMEKGTSNGSITDIDGKFAILVNDVENLLLVTYLGYQSQEISIKNKLSLSVVLIEDTQLIDEVVVVGYGTQKKGNLTGSVSMVSSKELTVAPVGKTTNALAGRLPGLVAVQSSGMPGSDEAKLKIRGFDEPLVIVDGVEAPFLSIDPNIIESISILKDGSASIYGSRAGSGVILVTTKRGINQKPTITFSANLSFQGITAMPKTVNAGQYAELMTEKWLHEGRDPDKVPFTTEQIQKYYDGTDPQYTSTNWYNEIIRDWSPMQQYNLSVRGGSESIKYYGFIGYMEQESMFKKNGGGYKRYNIQSNIDATINKNLSFRLDAAGIIENDIASIRVRDNAQWADFWSTIPIYPATLPDPTKISYADGSGTGGAHVSTNYDLYGYDKRENQNYKITGTLIYKVPGVSGLTAKLLVNSIANYNKITRFSKPIDFYTYDIASETYTLTASMGSKANLDSKYSKNYSITTQASLEYDKIFNKKHHLTALALFEGIDSQGDWLQGSRENFLSPAIEEMFGGDNTTAKNDGNASEMGRMSYVGRLNYTYSDKYIFEATFRADASAKFSPSKRWGYFPSFSGAWRISQESFMQNINFLDNLKVRVNYGKSGNDNVVNFQYLSGFNLRTHSGYLLGDKAIKPISPSVIPNPYLSWEEIEIINGGLEFSFLNKKIYGEFDVFYRERTGIPEKRNATLPSTFGADLPQENINSLSNRGFEFMLGSRFQIKDFIFDVSGNIAYSRDKWIHYEEQEYTDLDEIRIKKLSGNYTDRIFGYKSDKLFATQAEIDALPYEQDNNQNKSLRPGDVKFIDMNEDGKLDWRDQVEIGNKVPHWTTGINININYKNFDLSALFQGAFGYYTDTWLMRSSTKVFSEEVYKLRWTDENNNINALVPRVGGTSINGSDSDYRYKKAGYLRLKSASIGYNVPKRLLNKISVENARFSLSGTNIFTFNRLRKYGIDPETPFQTAGYYYPQQRTISVGLNVSF